MITICYGAKVKNYPEDFDINQVENSYKKLELIRYDDGLILGYKVFYEDAYVPIRLYIAEIETNDYYLPIYIKRMCDKYNIEIYSIGLWIFEGG